MKKGAQWRAQLIVLVFILLVLATALWLFLGSWVYQPLLIVGFSILGTQCGAEFGRRILANLASKMNQAPTLEAIYQGQAGLSQAPKAGLESAVNEPHSQKSPIEDQLNAIVLSRVQQSQAPAGSAVNSYLSQVVGTFAMAVLVIGLCVVIFARAMLVGDRPSWMAIATFAIALIVIAIFMWIILGEPFYKSLSPYYNWHSFFPPKSALTFFRVAVLIIYSILVFMLYYPEHGTAGSVDTRTVPSRGEVEQARPNSKQ